LHYVEAGEGPLIVLLHGFPEFWYGWRSQIEPLAAAGFRVVAPDLRGYNLSSKPDGVAAYDGGQLAADIRGLIHERGAESALLVGHDWGGTIAWTTAMHHPEVVDRLAILNAAHPRKLSQGLHHPGQLRRSWYFFFFDLPELPPSCTPTAGISSGTSCTTPARPIRRRRSTATSRRGRNRARPPG
jgi:pimeloyl-ACP methyl ester carboxylesterase